MKVAIIACVKCEERYICEWLDWHISIGVEHFFLADNNEEDYSPTLESIVCDYIEQDVVTIIDYCGIKPVQPLCYNSIMEMYGNVYDWYAMIDVDEFLCLPMHNSIHAFLKSIPQDTDIIHLHWRLYGDNDLLTYDNRPVQERFTVAVENNSFHHGYCKYIKSIFRNKAHLDNKIGNPLVINNHHSVNDDEIMLRRNSLGEQIVNPRCFMCDFKEEEFNIAYIKHFITKTSEEYIDKRKRGDSFRKHGNNGKYSEHFFFIFNKETKEKVEYFKKNFV